MIHVIMGPTASGKTAAANALSDFYKAPIINADAFQIYKGMNIGTGKLSENDPHYGIYHLLDIILPNQSYSSKQYQDDFRKVINELLKDNENIIVCGGTGLYIRAALYDYSFIDEVDNGETYDDLSNEELFALLEKLDLETSKTIHVNNRKRVIRAINLIKNSGVKKSDLISSQKHELIYPDVKFYFINPDREVLYNNINNRVDEMIKNGLENEVRNLLANYDFSSTAFQGIGYKEMIEYINGNLSKEDAIELIKKRSRNYAKRQATFFKNQFKTQTFSNYIELINEVTKNG